MSEPIQSIAQNNYILHNIDAKKLYVQEPLFTANSGDAVYVGWRPDETVLYSGSLPSLESNITLSETWNNFEYVDFSLGSNNPYITRYETSSLSDSRVALKFCWAYNYMQEGFIKLTPTEDENVWTYKANTLVQYKHNNTAITVINNDTTYLTSAEPIKIVGINRKENA